MVDEKLAGLCATDTEAKAPNASKRNGFIFAIKERGWYNTKSRYLDKGVLLNYATAEQKGSFEETTLLF